MSRRATALFALTSLTALGACAGQPPPMSRVTSPAPKHAEGTAKLVFLWPPDSCEGGGYQVITTHDGAFIGTVGRGTRLETDLAPGTRKLITWNPEKERFGAVPAMERVGVLHADLLAGRTYFVRMTFGEWDVHGPRVVTRGWKRMCIDGDATLVALPPQSAEWSNLRSWLDDLTPVTADHAAGQSWLADQPWLVPTHRELASSRELRWTREARTLATLTPSDGVLIQP